jgi:hypothetical protein
VLVASRIQFSAVAAVYRACPNMQDGRCSDVSFIGTIISKKLQLLFVFSLLM